MIYRVDIRIGSPVAYNGRYSLPVSDVRTLLADSTIPDAFANGGDLSDRGFPEVTQTAPPAYNVITHKVVEDAPVLQNGVWTQVWTSPIPLTGGEQTGVFSGISNTLMSAVQRYMDERVKAERQYDNVLSLTKYVNSANVSWATEAASGLAWNTAVLVYLLQAQADVVAGNRPVPIEADLIAEIALNVPLVWGT